MGKKPCPSKRRSQKKKCRDMRRQASKTSLSSLEKGVDSVSSSTHNVLNEPFDQNEIPINDVDDVMQMQNISVKAIDDSYIAVTNSLASNDTLYKSDSESFYKDSEICKENSSKTGEVTKTDFTFLNDTHASIQRHSDVGDSSNEEIDNNHEFMNDDSLYKNAGNSSELHRNLSLTSTNESDIFEANDLQTTANKAVAEYSDSNSIYHQTSFRDFQNNIESGSDPSTKCDSCSGDDSSTSEDSTMYSQGLTTDSEYSSTDLEDLSEEQRNLQCSSSKPDNGVENGLYSDVFFKSILSGSDSDDASNEDVQIATESNVDEDVNGHSNSDNIRHYNISFGEENNFEIVPVKETVEIKKPAKKKLSSSRRNRNFERIKQIRAQKRIQDKSNKVDDAESIDEHSQESCKSRIYKKPKYPIIIDSDNDSEYDSTDESDYDRTDRTIIGMRDFFKNFKQTFDDHKQALSTCQLQHWHVIGKKNYGYVTKSIFKCNNCQRQEEVSHESFSPNVLDINTAAVAATIIVGIGHTQLTELLAYMGIQGMSAKTYISKQQKICYNSYQAASAKSMREAAAEEVRLAIENNEVTKDGIPVIKVSIDGSWMKRTYGSHWNSKAGTASIIGWRTGKVLYFATRNNYCHVCNTAVREGRQPKKHDCYKNWSSDQPSTGMENDIILKGFQESVEKHNLIYGTVVMDNDSSLYKSLVDHRVYSKYDIVPQRILCSLHLRKNVKKNLLQAAKSTSTARVGERGIGAIRNLITQNVGSIMKKIEDVTQRRIDEKNRSWVDKIEQLRLDILNIPNHVFGDHQNCIERGDKCEIHEEGNRVAEIKRWGLYEQIEKIMTDLSYHSESLLHNITTNTNECLNSLICHSTGGKRINWALRNQYPTRVAASVLQFNDGRAMSKFYEINRKVIPLACRDVEDRRLQKLERDRVTKKLAGKRKFTKQSTASKNQQSSKYYGKKHEDVDKTDEQVEREKNELMQKLLENQRDRLQIQEDTVHQIESNKWVSTRKRMLTSSNFGEACTWNPSKSCASKVQKILYPPIKKNFEVEQKRLSLQKKQAREQLAKDTHFTIHPCGLAIDEKYEFLGATVDGLIDEVDDEMGILIVKCPSDKFNNLSSELAITGDKDLKKIFAWKDVKGEKTLMIKPRSHVYYQVQGALHIHQRDYCILMVHTLTDYTFLTVYADYDFWETKMEEQLSQFYKDCLMPEILDSRHNRSMPIRDPEYAMEKIEKALKKKEEKKAAKLEIAGKNAKKDNEDCESCCKRRKIDLTDNEESINPPQNDDHNIEPEIVGVYYDPKGMSPEHARDFYDNRQISIDRIKDLEILPAFKWLDDDSLDYVIRLLKMYHGDRYDIQSVNYVFHPYVTLPVTRSSVQIIGGRLLNHWRTAHFDFDTRMIYIYDSYPRSSYYGKLHPQEMAYVKQRFSADITDDNIIFVPVLANQSDCTEPGSACGLYATAFAVSLFLGEDPSQTNYSMNVAELRRHMADMVDSKVVTPFPIW